MKVRPECDFHVCLKANFSFTARLANYLARAGTIFDRLRIVQLKFSRKRHQKGFSSDMNQAFWDYYAQLSRVIEII